MKKETKSKPEFKNILKEKDCFDCLNCCYFSKEEEHLLPFLSIDESKKSIFKKNITRRKNGLSQVICKNSYKYKHLKKCIFLKESKHGCKIYKDRPIECILWPFVIAHENDKIYICSVDREWCPKATKNKISNPKTIDNLLRYLQAGNILEEIKKKERYLWPMEDYYVKIIEINNRIKNI